MIQDVELISKRGTPIPCTITLPKEAGPRPLVLMAHGFCATRDENGSFVKLAKRLTEAGCATIRCDFPGCNDSKEDHIFNNLENNMDNLDTLLEAMKERIEVDEKHIAAVGYSMGGKVVLHYTRRHPEIQTIALWAPAAMNGLEGTLGDLGDPQWQKRGLEIAKKDGVFLYPNTFDDRIIRLGEDFFEQAIHSRANDYFSAFEGNVIMVNGDKDDIIPPDVLSKVAASANPKAHFVHHVVAGANHGFGAWTNEPEQMEELVDVTARFLLDCLTK